MAQAFSKWETESVNVEDAGLRGYLTTDAKFVPKTGARYGSHRFHKSKVFIVERLINKIMVSGHKSKKHFRSSGHFSGKAPKAYSMVEDALQQVENRTKQNPIAVLVKAIENAAPREEIVSIEQGGVRYPKAVDCAPQRRIDLVLRYVVQGALDKSFNKKKSMSSAIAEEILNAYNSDAKSMAVSKKQEIERQADSSR